jgi:lactate dehydrogenase-like 2-hydroxyacid dehydrogenase
MNAARLQQILDYAKALKVAAQYGRGSVKDTADIVKALEELQAYHAMWASMNRQQREQQREQPRAA